MFAGGGEDDEEAGRGASGACVIGVRGRDAGGRAWGAGSLRRRRAGAGAGGRVRDHWRLKAPRSPAASAPLETLGRVRGRGRGGAGAGRCVEMGHVGAGKGHVMASVGKGHGPASAG